MTPREAQTRLDRVRRPRALTTLRPAPGHRAMTLAAVTIGVVLLGIQLWLLTVAVDLYLGGEAAEAWTLAVASGLVFLGGLFAYWLLGHRPSNG